ncbi:lytic murein transglycosylase [Erythrobacter litoralis]|jgi:lytic murein transglycosylase|uniref:Lytic transglycosylase n=1 Tax=Erythrobacter litoralis TaxID=39960 RepID=A0A074NMG1_9SPHN|nr:lytic murein transglycosylase [Erythrobacter litoralis]AOL23524.1 lytic murein transglycosylase [Erythrobacter litoralis]KEO98992.1 lytic transglycosylase [Erythrobacter litoralis]MEE4339791.1 lytic murein transglycosylase [Erythrobacter sp.]
MIFRILTPAILAVTLLLSGPATPLRAQVEAVDNVDFDTYVGQLAARARAEGVSEATVRRMTAGLSPDPRVIRLDRGQPGSPTRSGYPALAPYIDKHVNPVRINGGRDVYRQHSSALRRIERDFGVPPQIIVAIFGHETSYGRITGGFDLARSLATLAWEGRRRELFADEFIALLKVADRGFARNEMTGSWAGAMGYPQFLPSVYQRLAVDGDGDGRANIFGNRIDTFASIANYFRDAGWRSGQPWGVRASVPGGFDVDAYRTKLEAPVCPRVHERHSRWMSVDEWRALGVVPQRPLPGDMLVSLFQPDGPGTPAWLLTGNYRVILEYNCSNYYAMSVGLLADEIVN